LHRAVRDGKVGAGVGGDKRTPSRRGGLGTQRVEITEKGGTGKLNKGGESTCRPGLS